MRAGRHTGPVTAGVNMRCHSFSSHSLQSLIGCDTRASCSERWCAAGVRRMVARAGDTPGQKVRACSPLLCLAAGPAGGSGHQHPASFSSPSSWLQLGGRYKEERGFRGGGGCQKAPLAPTPEVSLSSWTESIMGGGGRRKKEEVVWVIGKGGDAGVGRGCVPPGTSLSTRERERERER